MNKAFLYARKTGRAGTYVVELPMDEAVKVIRNNRGSGIQIGILGGSDFSTVKRVYGEFAPYYQVKDVQSALRKVR